MFKGTLNPFFGYFRSMLWFAGEGEGGGGEGGEQGGEGGAGGSGGAGAGNANWYDGFSAEVKNSPSIQRYKSSEEISKAYLNLERKIGAKGVIIPNKNASKEEIDAFHKELGRPDKAEEYQIAIPENLHKSITSNAESQKVFKGQCHKLGLSSEQTQGLHAWYMTELSNSMKQQEVADGKARDEAKTALNAKWGTTYDANLKLAEKVVNKFGGEKVLELFKDGLGANPLVLEMFANIGEKLSEDALGPGGKSQYGGLTPAAAQAKITEIRSNPKSAYNDENNPTHKEAVEELTSLYKITEGV